MALQFLNDGVFGGNVTATGRLQVGDGTDGYFYKYADGNTGFAGGNLIINNDVLYYNNWATNQYHGEASGASHFFRGNALSGNNWLITTAGLFGVGTVFPQYKLDVQGDLALTEGNEVYGLISPLQNRQGMQIAVGDPAYKTAPLVTFQGSDQKVGIGTTTPTSLLEISQQLSAASTIDYPYTISSRDDANSINQAGGEGVGIKFRIAGNAATTPGDSLVGASIAAIRESASDTDSSTGLGLFVTQNDETLDEALRISHDGNVGIGKDNPTARLDLKSEGTNKYVLRASRSSNGSGLFGFYEDGGGNCELYLRDSAGTAKILINGNGDSYFNGGQVGVGTTNPQVTLQVGDGAANDVARVLYSDGSYTEMLGYGLQFNRSTSYIRPTSNNSKSMNFGYPTATWAAINFDATQYDLKSNGTSRLIIKSDGDVGIGTTAPGTKLDVKSSSTNAEIIAQFGNGNIQGGLEIKTDGNIEWGFNVKNTRNFTFSTNQIERMRISSVGNVGIGTETPDGALEVEGGTTISSVADFLTKSNTVFSLANPATKFGIGYNASDNPILQGFNVNGAKDIGLQVYGGDVGIGTASPQSKLHVSSGGGGNGDCVLLIEADTDNTVEASNPILRLKQDGGLVTGALSLTSGNNMALYNEYAGNLFLGVGNSPKMTIVPNGDVGIGTTTPNAKLELSSAQPRIRLRDTTTGVSSGYTTGAIDFYTSDASSEGNAVNAKIESYADSIYGRLGLRFFTGGGGAPTQAMTVNWVGDVGIGTTTPGYKLDVSGNGKFSNTSEGSLIIKHNYGYQRPNWAIKLDGDANTSGGYLSQYVNQGGFALNQGGTYYSSGLSRTDTNSTSYSSVAGVSGVLAFYTNYGIPVSTNFYPSERMRISASGNVGIGITSPSTKLNVNGDIKIEGTGALFLGGSGVVPDWQISASTNDITIANVGGNSGSVFFNNSYGVAFPRLTTTQINAMPASVLTQGLMAYNTTLNTICFYNGSSWQKVSHSNM